MAIVDSNAFDGFRACPDLLTKSGLQYDTNHLILFTMSQGEFIVLQGLIPGSDAAASKKVTNALAAFDATIVANKSAGPAALRKALETAMAEHWTACVAGGDCPFDLEVEKIERLVFHMAIDGWSFEEARIKFKTLYRPGQFTDLEWLGDARKRTSFALTNANSRKKTYGYALYIQIQHGDMLTRLVIDPDTGDNGHGSENP